MYAVILSGGKQYRVCSGDIVYVEKLDAKEGDEVTFSEVLAAGDENGIKVGTPTVKGASVTGKVVKQVKSKKVTVFTYRPKKDSKRKLGHRQQYTKVEITAVNG